MDQAWWMARGRQEAQENDDLAAVVASSAVLGVVVRMWGWSGGGWKYVHMSVVAQHTYRTTKRETGSRFICNSCVCLLYIVIYVQMI